MCCRHVGKSRSVGRRWILLVNEGWRCWYNYSWPRAQIAPVRQVVVGLGRVAKAEMDSIRDTISRRPGDQEANKTIHYRLNKKDFSSNKKERTQTKPDPCHSVLSGFKTTNQSGTKNITLGYCHVI